MQRRKRIMKNIKYMIAAACVVLLSACQDKGEWDAPAPSANSQYGNNNIVENNVKSIKDVITTYASTIANDDMKEITEDLQVRGRVTGNDISGNFYKKITIQDNLGTADSRALTISIDESGIWGYLPLGQEIVVDLKGLWIGGYGKAPTIGTPYTNAKGATSVGRMSKHLWNNHFKIVGDIQKVEPMIIGKDDLSTLNEMENGVPKHAGKLIRLQNVTFKNADGKSTFKSGTESALTGYFIQCLNEFYVSGTDDKKQTVQIFTSGDYAKFSSMILPYDTKTEKPIPCDLIGIAGYYSGLWQISIIETAPNGIVVPSTGATPGPDPQPTGDIFSYTFDSSQGEFVIDNKSIGDGITYVWNYDSKNKYMKASAYKGGCIASESWLVSPKFSLANVTAATLTFNNACNQVKEGTITDHIHVMVSTDGTNWTEATIANLPSGTSWDFIDSTVDLKNFVGKANVQVAFKYVSTASIAPTWEIKSLTVK